MKGIMKFSLGVLLSLGLATQAYAAILIVGGPHDGTDVGQIDNYITEAELANAGDAAVLNWINAELGTSFDTVVKQEGVSWYNTNTTDVIAFLLLHGPGHYIIKNANLFVLFENLTEINWGVIDLGEILGNINLGDDMQISFVAEFGSAPVPEPGTLALLGAGLLLIGLRRRRTTV